MTETSADQALPTPAEQQRFAALVQEVMTHYRDGRYAAALTLVRRAESSLPMHRADVAHFAACLLALDDRPQDAFNELRAAYDSGCWWDRRIIDNDDDLASLQDLPGFAALVTDADRRAQQSQRVTAPPPVIVRPDGDERALLVALHGAGSDGQRTAEIWRPLVGDGLTVVAPTSPQRMTPTRRSWLDPEIGSGSIAAALEEPPLTGSLPIVAAGFSAGGRQALQWALTGNPVGPQAFLVVCPSIDIIRIEPGDLSAAAARGLRGHVIVGSSDPGLEQVQVVCETLREAGLPTTIDVVDDLGHDYPDDFVDRARAALPGLLQHVG